MKLFGLRRVVAALVAVGAMVAVSVGLPSAAQAAQGRFEYEQLLILHVLQNPVSGYCYTISANQPYNGTDGTAAVYGMPGCNPSDLITKMPPHSGAAVHFESVLVSSPS